MNTQKALRGMQQEFMEQPKSVLAGRLAAVVALLMSVHIKLENKQEIGDLERIVIKKVLQNFTNVIKMTQVEEDRLKEELQNVLKAAAGNKEEDIGDLH